MVLMLAPVVSHDQKSYVIPCFDFLYLTNAVVLLVVVLASCNADTSTNGVTGLKNSCCTSFQASRPNGYSDAIDGTVDITWCQHRCKWCHMTRKVMMHLVSIILTYQMQWCHWQCCQDHVMLTPVPVMSHGQKRYIILYFNLTYLINAVVPLMMLFGVTWCQHISTLIKLWCTSFWLSHHNGCIGAIDSAADVTWCQYQGCHMAKKSHALPCFNCIDLTSVTWPENMLYF